MIITKCVPKPLAVLAWVGCALLSALVLPLEGFAMEPSDLQQFANDYAAAWSSQDRERLASFYSKNGELIVNGGEPAVGRAGVAAKAGAFMGAFPDMLVVLDRLVTKDGGAEFHWIWTGTNTGPGGTGHAVNLKGYEDWSFGPDGLIVRSDGHYDAAEYQRQVNGEGAQ